MNHFLAFYRVALAVLAMVSCLILGCDNTCYESAAVLKLNQTAQSRSCAVGAVVETHEITTEDGEVLLVVECHCVAEAVPR